MNEEKRNYCVYKHTSPSNKVYIGITINPKQRWSANGKQYISNQHFTRAINKYGWNNFKHEILFDNLTINEAKSKEIELIAYYDSTNPLKGYNISLGGDIMSESTRKKLSKARKGKISDKRLELIRNNSRKINQYDLQGNLIKTWDCFRDIKDNLFPNATDSCIYNCCIRKNVKSYYGFQWRYADDCNDIGVYEKYNQEIYNKNRNKSICEISLIDGSIIKIYKSSKQAQKELGFQVSASVVNRQPLVHNRLFINLSDYDNKEYVKQRLKQAKHLKRTSSKFVEEIDEDGNVLGKYNSIKEASEILGISHYGIGEVCKGKNKTTAHGRMFRYSTY